MPMPRIHLTTFIQSPPQRVFDLCRHLSLIKKSVLGKNESIMSSAGSTMVTNGDTITYHAKHLGKMRSVMLRITEFEKGQKLTEEQAILLFNLTEEDLVVPQCVIGIEGDYSDRAHRVGHL